MNEQELLYRETKLMEPILRMHHVIAAVDDIKAKTLTAVAVQYITEHYNGSVLTSADVQKILRAILLREEDGTFYAMYLRNELQVKFAGWMMLLAADLPVTLEQLGEISGQFAAKLGNQYCLTITAEQVLDAIAELVQPLNEELCHRMDQNRTYYLTELRQLLGEAI